MALVSDRFVLVLFCLCAAFVAEARRLNLFVRHFEPLSYEPLRVHRDHVRLRRSADQHRRGHVYLRFQGLNRLFNLKLRPDSSVFHKDLVMETESQGRIKPDINHIYTGELVGEASSHVYGSLVDGVFHGSIQSVHGRYYVEKAQRYFSRPQPFHSVLYDARDVHYPARTGPGGWCGVTGDTERWMDDVMRRRSPRAAPSARPKTADGLRAHMRGYRERWTGRKPLWEPKEDGAEEQQLVDVVPGRNASARVSGRYSRRVCNIKLSVDHLLYGRMHREGLNAARTRKLITGLIASHVHRASSIFRRTNFGGIQDISFIVQKIVINDSRSCAEGVRQNNPFCSNAIDASYLLHLTSKENNDDFCVAYTWTYRDFADGILGLAWIAKAQLGQGGICEKNRPSVDSQAGTNEYMQHHLSLNTGIVTFVNYNSHVVQRVSEITFAHELGHNFGSPHDSPPGVSCFGACAPCGARGNYIMFPSATMGSEFNNDKFSPCSIRNITEVLVPMFEGRSNRENCFQTDSGPICGNAIVEGEEACDCGSVGAECGETCCYPRQNNIGAPGCTLRKGAICSPSAGPCCDAQCVYLDSSAMCSPGGACRNASFCNGQSASCPLGSPVANMSVCNNGTQLCINGECGGSICTKYNLTQCTLTDSEYPVDDLCLLACRDAAGCRPACEFPAMKSHCGVKLTPGTPCNDLRGFCDVFSKCRDVDAEGPLTRLNRIFFGQKSINRIKEFISLHPLLSAFLALGSVWLMILVFRCLAVHTPTSNPNKKPAYKLKHTLKQPWSL